MKVSLMKIIIVAGGLGFANLTIAQALDLPIVPASVMKRGAETPNVEPAAEKPKSSQIKRASEKPLAMDGSPVVVPVSTVEDEVLADGSAQKKTAPVKVKTLRTVSKKVKQDLSPKPSSSGDGSADKTIATNNIIFVDDGVNQVLNVAVGHLNRIVTPFSEPRVMKTSEVTTKVQENVVYVAPGSYKKPVTMFIREAGSESIAISLTLVPIKIPPQEYELRINRRLSMNSQQSRPLAERWEKTNGYIQSIRNLPRALALGQIPQGFEFRGIDPSEQIPYCAQQGLAFDFENGQTLEGHNLKAVVGVVKNVSASPVEFVESNCAQPGVRAVAVWPQPFLQPGERSEVYVVGARATKVSPQSKRPSLLEENL